MLDELKLASSMLGGFDVFNRYIFYASLGFTVLLAACLYHPVHFVMLCLFGILTLGLLSRMVFKKKPKLEDDEDDAKP